VTECKMVKKTRVVWKREMRIVSMWLFWSTNTSAYASKFAHDLPEKVLILKSQSESIGLNSSGPK
jgi:hypothetical protein